MPVRRNNAYVDPGFATAFDNLAEAFKGPTGSDVLGYTKSAAEREKAARLADLYRYSQGPNFDQQRFDRMGVAVGNYAPTQSYYAVDENNDTTIRTNAATNATSLAVADKNNAGALARTMAAPVILGDGQTAFLPGQTQAATGLPGMFRGNITARQGETVVTPGGETVKGTPVAPTDSQIKGAIIQGLPANEQRAAALSSVPIANIVTGQGPRAVFSADAVGNEPHFNDTRQPQIANYKTADGKVGTASLNKDTGKWTDTQTGVELPAGSQTYTANLQGDKDQTGLGVSTKNNIDGMLVDLALTQDTSKRLRSIITQNPGVQGLVGSIRGTVQDVIQTGNEVGQLLNMNMDNLKKDIQAGRVDAAVAAKFSNFDPNIPAASMLETLLTAQVAKVLDPNGRISNDRYEQVAKALGNGGWTGNQQRTLATLDQLDKIIESRRGILAPAAPGAAKIGQQPAATAAPGVIERWERGPNNELRRVAQ